MSGLVLDGAFMIGSLAVSRAVLFLLIVAFTSILYGVFVGRDRVVHVLISLYLALAIVTNVPILSYLYQVFHSVHNITVQLLWFLGVFVVIFFVLWRSHILRGMAQARGRVWESCLFSVLQATLTLTMIGILLPTEATKSLPSLFINLFLSDIGRSLWLLAPFVALAVLGREGGEIQDI